MWCIVTCFTVCILTVALVISGNSAKIWWYISLIVRFLIDSMAPVVMLCLSCKVCLIFPSRRIPFCRRADTSGSKWYQAKKSTPLMDMVTLATTKRQGNARRISSSSCNVIQMYVLDRGTICHKWFIGCRHSVTCCHKSGYTLTSDFVSMRNHFLVFRHVMNRRRWLRLIGRY